MNSLPERERFDDALKEISKDAAAKMTDLEIDAIPMSQKWDRREQKSDDLGELNVWGKELIESIRQEADKLYESLNVDEVREEEEVLRVTKRAMTMAVERYGAVLDSFPKGEINDKVAVDEFWQRAAMVLNSVDERALMAQATQEEPGQEPMVEAFYKSIEATIPKDFTAVVERILTDELTPEDRDYIVTRLRHMAAHDSLEDIYTESTKAIQTGEVSLLMRNLRENPKELKKVVELAVAQPGGPAILLFLTGPYLTVAESEQYIAKALRSERDPDRIQAFQKVDEFIHGEKMDAVVKEIQEGTKEIRKHADHIYGHKNQALAKLSYGGIFGTYMKLMAGSALTLSLIPNWRNPVKFITNPVTLAALMAGTVGAEIDPSDIGVWPKAGTYLSRLTQDRDVQEQAEIQDKYAYFKEDVLNHPAAAELYYNLNDRMVMEVKNQITEGTALADVSLTFESLKVDYDKLPARFKTVPKDQVEARFSDWARTFFYEEGLNRPSVTAQRLYLDQMREERQLAGKWPSTNLDIALT